MADPDTLIKAKIHYYCREKQFHSMQFAAVEGMKRFRYQVLISLNLIYLPSIVFSGDPAFKFFYGMALVLEGQLQEGIRELDTVQNYTEVSPKVTS